MERKILISDLTVGYEGLFSSSDLFKFIEDWFHNNGYQKNEIKHIEKVSEKGKNIVFEIMPYKEINDYTRFEIYIRLRINDLTDTKVKKDKQEFKINKGKIYIGIDAFLAADIRNRWESRPGSFLIRTIFNKFIGREYIAKFEKGLMEDVKNFHGELKSYLNLNKYKEQA